MDATTPANTSGFSRKPNRKKRRSSRSRKSNGFRMQSALEEMPSDMKAWLFGSIFLMAVAKVLAPEIGFSATLSEAE